MLLVTGDYRNPLDRPESDNHGIETKENLKLLASVENVSQCEKFIPTDNCCKCTYPRKSRCCGLYNLNRIQAHWTAHSEFTHLTIQKNCIKHHTPDVVLKYMLELQSQEHTLDDMK